MSCKATQAGRLWLNDGSCVRLRPEYPYHVWSYDFVEARTHDGRKHRMLNIIDEFARECITSRVNRRLKAADIIDALSDLLILRHVPGHIRTDNGPEFIVRALREWIFAVGAKTAYVFEALLQSKIVTKLSIRRSLRASVVQATTTRGALERDPLGPISPGGGRFAR